MTFDTSKPLLEGIRFSGGNNIYTFPPDSLIVDEDEFNKINERSEYLIVADSLDDSKKQLEIGDEDLVFFWSRNEPGITRFDYDGYSNRWLTIHGTYPLLVGTISQGLSIPHPQESKKDESPFSLYIDDDPRINFSLKFVGSNEFTDPTLIPNLTVEINSQGILNFSSYDLIDYDKKQIMFIGQNYVSRSLKLNKIGGVPDFITTDYRIFLNPKPATGNHPLIRIGYGRYLKPIEVNSEWPLSSPDKGHFKWSSGTGRIKLSDEDISSNIGEFVYYDGVYLGSKRFDRYNINPVDFWPNVSFNISKAIGATNSKRFVVFVEKDGETRRYFDTTSISPPSSGSCYLNLETGDFYLTQSDVTIYSDWNFKCIDTVIEIGAPGVGVQMKRSSINVAGESVVADFAVHYGVSQTLSDNLNSFPFMMLPNVPVVDGDLNFQVDMGVGRFLGSLNDSSDIGKFGYGYLLNLDAKQLKFTVRTPPRAIELLKDQDSVKLDGAALVERGIEIRKNGVLLSRSDFDLDMSTGLIEFVESVGEGDADAVNLTGNANGNTFYSSDAYFNDKYVDKKLLVISGKNSGVYDIISVRSIKEVSVFPSFKSKEITSVSVRSTDEIISDRFWTSIVSIPKKFHLYRSKDGENFEEIKFGKYSVKSNVGQVNIINNAIPDEVFKIEYESLDSDDEGVTVKSKSRTEYALFKISLESAEFKIGSKDITFNSNNKTVSTSKPISVYVNGVVHESFSYEHPNKIKLDSPVESGPVNVSYWVNEANGGENIFDLLHAPIDYDILKVYGPQYDGTEGQNEISVNGDQTDVLISRCALLINNKDVVYVSESAYDSKLDTTTAKLNQRILEDSDNIKITGKINNTKTKSSIFRINNTEQPYLILEEKTVEIFVNGTNTIRMHGKSLDYKPYTIIDFDGDPYLVSGSEYDEVENLTIIKTHGNSRRNYITPMVKRSIRQILDPIKNFYTSRPAHIARGFTLAKMGKTSSVLVHGVDYNVGDGGVITLNHELGYGDILRAMYVAKVSQPMGTVFEFNFSREVEPNNTNGLAGQKLIMNYNLYAPDSFFYRVETVSTMLPEAKDLMVNTGSSMPSGPNIQSSPSQANKDSGYPSPWHDVMHYTNIDSVVKVFLKYYQDLIDNYEDLLEYVDGRIVGGESGRFRYDGVTNRAVENYSSIKNDIDDSVVLYNKVSMSSGYPPEPVYEPVYGKMLSSNNLSRIFPNYKVCSSFIGNVVPTEGAEPVPVGNFGVKNMVSVGKTVTSRSVAYFTSSLKTELGTQLTLDSSYLSPDLVGALAGKNVTTGTNGDPHSFTPTFTEDQKIKVYDLDGNFLSDGKVLMVDETAPHLLPTTVPYSSIVTNIGCVVQSEVDTMLNSYTPITDYLYNSENGQILYYKTSSNNPLVGNETIESPISFMNADMAPNKVPALYGSELNDSGKISIPRKRKNCELRVILNEKSSVKVGSCVYVTIGGPLTITSSTSPLVFNESLKFTSGPNNGFTSKVLSVNSNSVLLNSMPTNVDIVGSDFVVNNELFGNVYAGYSILNREIDKLDLIIDMFGDVVKSGSGESISNLEWEDNSSDLFGFDGMLLFIKNGQCRGLYKIQSSGANSLTISADQYSELIMPGSGDYSIIKPFKFLQESNFQFVSQFYRDTLVFQKSTSLWYFNPGMSDYSSRLKTMKQRQSYLLTVVDNDSGSLTSLLKNNLYDMRYLWINRRTNRETGIAQLHFRAIQQLIESIQKIIDYQMEIRMMELAMSQA